MSLSRYVQRRYDCGDNDTWNSQRRLRYTMPRSKPSLSELAVHLAIEKIETDINAEANLNIDDTINYRTFLGSGSSSVNKITSEKLAT